MDSHRSFLQYCRHFWPKKRDVKFVWQRLTRGWDDSETWSIDYSLSKIILPRLKRFTEVRCGHPYDMTDEEWQRDLGKMIAAFEFAGSDKRWEAEPEEYKKHQEGIDLFAKNFFSLWW
jgi:hypothetical protein